MKAAEIAGLWAFCRAPAGAQAIRSHQFMSFQNDPMSRGRRAQPSLAGLQAFEATARLGGVSRAAAELHLTQSAVSRQVLALEEQLGVQLFRRVKKRLLLSEAGAAYLHDVRGVLAALGDATDALVATRGRSGTLRIATLPTFGAKW